ALFEHGIAALRAERRLHGVRENVDTLDHAVAGVIGKADFFSCHVLVLRLLAFDDGHDVFFAHDQKIFAVDFHFRSAVLAEQNLVADFHIEGTDLAVFENLAFADRHDLSLNGLFGRAIGNDDTARGGAFLLETFHDDAVMKRTNLHGYRSLGSWLMI